MVPVEHLHLKHVLQTVCVLESVILRSFGPDGGQVLFIRDTGQAMLSRSGARILTALRLEHPIARMVVECVLKHSIITGDGSKTFILLLASLLRMIHATACKESNVSQTYNSRDAAEAATARRLADELLQSAAVLALAAQADMCIVECVSEDELSLFAQLSGARPVSDCSMIEPDQIATLTFCRPILLGAHRYVHVAFHDSEERVMVAPCSLVICGPGEGPTDQYVCAFQDAIRMLLSTWEPMSMTAVAASKRTLHLLAKALLSVPRQIYFHSPRSFLQTQTRLLSFIENHSHPLCLIHKQEHSTVLVQGQDESVCPLEEGKQSIHCCREDDVSSKIFILDLGLESVSCKYQLLLAVLQCVSSLLRMDTMLCTHSALHTQSRRLANISWEGTEDEAEE
ncbi:Bardet-Biedl syndrome 10 protein [Nibea albiflora]|uniref:Bardet-Biedl syndrome 10 protein n=1 Tax=Nibea albiflora TaxID=240163 RepID=A0ACB7FDN0_NIBAL|nr:Bardet-Biedl syndrome 10 protein [Nibea albiflora]